MSFWDDQHEDQRPFTRMMFQPMSGTGMAGYAISLTGAKKMLYHQSMTPFSDSVDDGLWKFLHWREDFSNFTAVAPWPRIVASSVAPGSAEKETDLEGHTTHGNVEEPYSQALMYSTRMNVQKVYMGETLFQAQYATETGVQNMTIEEIGEIRGHAERLEPDEFGKLTARIIRDAIFSQ